MGIFKRSNLAELILGQNWLRVGALSHTVRINWGWGNLADYSLRVQWLFSQIEGVDLQTLTIMWFTCPPTAV